MPESIRNRHDADRNAPLYSLNSFDINYIDHNLPKYTLILSSIYTHIILLHDIMINKDFKENVLIVNGLQIITYV